MVASILQIGCMENCSTTGIKRTFEQATVTHYDISLLNESQDIFSIQKSNHCINMNGPLHSSLSLTVTVELA